MARLFSPLDIRSVHFKNRIFVSPMCMYSAEDGKVNDWHFTHAATRAIGGAALFIVEATAISPGGRISFGDAGLWNDQQIDSFSRLARTITKNGAVAGIQLAHAGRKASCARPWEGGYQLKLDKNGWETIAPSSIPFKDTDRQPKELSPNGINKIIDDFVSAAERAQKAGFKVLEIHMAHGYLLHSFLSPVSNHRKDEYGASFKNRIRLPMRVAKSVREVWPDDLPLFVRLSTTDYLENGWDIQQSILFAKELRMLGIDFIDCSSGMISPAEKIPFAPGFQVPFAQQIKHESEIITGAVGLITESAQADTIIKTKQADAVLLARQLLRDPYWPLNAARELGIELEWPKQYSRAKP